MDSMTLKEAIDSVLCEEEGTIGRFYMGRDWKVLVYSKEGRIPHCHVESDKGTACPRLDTPDYFIHPGKELKFNAKELKVFIDFMNIYWKQCVDAWNTNNGDHLTCEKPDYSKMPRKE